MKRFYQFILIVTFLPLSWLLLQVVHELGHVIGAYSTGGGVTRVFLHPLIISATAVLPNPHPVIVVWMGPLVGTLLPLTIWAIVKYTKLSGVYLYQFFAGFCLIANGVYIGAGSFYLAGDTDDLVFYGTPNWQMILFGVIAIPLGLYLWNNLGTHFGLGKGKGEVNKQAAIISCSLLLAVIVLELATY